MDDAEWVISNRQAKKRADNDAHKRHALASVRPQAESALYSAAERLRDADYPENEYFTWCLDGGTRKAAWVFQTSSIHDRWIGVVGDKATLIELTGTIHDRYEGRLQVGEKVHIHKIDDVVLLNGIKEFLKLCASSPPPTFAEKWGD